MEGAKRYVGFVCNHPCIPYALEKEKRRLGQGMKLSPEAAIDFIRREYGTHGFVIEQNSAITNPEEFAHFYNAHNGLALPVIDGDVQVG